MNYVICKKIKFYENKRNRWKKKYLYFKFLKSKVTIFFYGKNKRLCKFKEGCLKNVEKDIFFMK